MHETPIDEQHRGISEGEMDYAEGVLDIGFTSGG